MLKVLLADDEYFILQGLKRKGMKLRRPSPTEKKRWII